MNTPTESDTSTAGVPHLQALTAAILGHPGDMPKRLDAFTAALSEVPTELRLAYTVGIALNLVDFKEILEQVAADHPDLTREIEAHLVSRIFDQIVSE